MNRKTEKYIAFYAAAILFCVGVVCYAVLPEKKLDIPVRIMFQSTGGNVLFSHDVHADPEAYGLKCADCHPAWNSAETKRPGSCTGCHKIESPDGEILKRSDALHAQCMGCHEEGGHGPVEKCTDCHVL